MTADVVRPDGLIEREGTWADIGVGSMILAGGRKWTVIDSAIPEQFGYGKSLWFRMQAPKGEIVNYAPQRLRRRITLLIDPNAAPVEPKLPHGATEAAMLVEKLGATEIATQDRATGEIWCPSYAAGHDATGNNLRGREEYLHLRLAHGVDTTGLEAIEDPGERVVQKAIVHGQLHSGKLPATGGFAHRHVPEDLTIT